MDNKYEYFCVFLLALKIKQITDNNISEIVSAADILYGIGVINK